MRLLERMKLNEKMSIQDFFKLGMKRDIHNLIPPRLNHYGGNALNLGAGNSLIAGTDPLDLPEWNAEDGMLPARIASDSVDTIFAFHFFEHLTGAKAIRILRECERVLKVGGTLNVVVPHRLSQMAYHDLDHKSFWTEETWKVLFSTPYYDKNRETPWLLEVNVNLIIGVVERNLALMTQLVKGKARG